jgi:hypothetical protein
MKISLRICVGLSSVVLVSAADQKSDVPATSSQLNRTLSVRYHEVFDQRKLRVYAIADEFDSEGRFLLNTLDARAFKLFSRDPKDAPLEVISLSTVATKSPTVPRETAIIFESSSSMSQQQASAVRKAVASFLGGFRSDVLSVRMGNNENNTRLAWISPTQSENPRAVQRAVLDSPPIAGARGLKSAVCAGIRDLNVLGEQLGTMQVQRNVIIVSSDLSQINRGFSDVRGCLSEAIDFDARIFWVGLKDFGAAGFSGTASTATPTPAPTVAATPIVDVDALKTSVGAVSGASDFAKVMRAAVSKSGGFASELAGHVDPTSALNNLRSYLDDEYILEFDLSNFRPFSDVIELELTASYHGHVLKTGFFKAEGFATQPTPEELARASKIQEASRRRELANFIFSFVLVSLTGIFFWLRLRKRAHVCQDCTFVVAPNFQDCPFRNAKCYGRLSVIHGSLVGKVFPLFSGENSLGRARANSIRLKGSGIQGVHAKIDLSKRKALLTPMSRNGLRVNGILTTEPRLVGSGSVIILGDLVCRLDFKEGE